MHNDEPQLKRWEFNSLTIESVLLGACSMAAITVLGRRAAPSTPAWIWFALGFIAVQVVLLPIQSAYRRSSGGGEATILRGIAGIVLGGILAAAIFALI